MRPDKRTRQAIRAKHTAKRKLVQFQLGLTMPMSDVSVSTDTVRLMSNATRCSVAPNLKGSEARARNSHARHVIASETGMVGRRLTKRKHREVISKFNFRVHSFE